MSSHLQRITPWLTTVLESVPLGTNLGLLHLIWTLLTGRLLLSRGALLPALTAFGLSPAASRRALAALDYGQWSLPPLLTQTASLIREEGRWQPCSHGGFEPVAVDLTAFFRPRLRNCPTTHYHPHAGKARPAIPLGLVAEIGTVGTQRVPVLVEVQRSLPEDPRETALTRALLKAVALRLGPRQFAVFDAGFHLSDLRQAQVPRFLLRLRRNCVLRRAAVPAYSGRGRPPKSGPQVRPLPREYQGKWTPATAPDHVETWTEGTRTYRAEFWNGLLGGEDVAEADPLQVIALWDPRYAVPWVLALRGLTLTGPEARDAYGSRWPVEQIPLAAKQLLGGGRQFVSSSEARQRLPELLVWTGALLSHLGATSSPVATGYWDCRPRATPGRLRRVLAGATLADLPPLPPAFRKKDSQTSHLPVGRAAPRRRRPATHSNAVPAGP